jgi:hypothetical protein
VPLSENEQRLLEQIERGLLADDPKFADKVRSTDPRHRAVRRGALAAALFLAGVAIMVFGLIISRNNAAGLPLGIFGFVVMFGAAVLGVQSYLYTGRGGDQKPLHVVGGDPKARGRARGHRSSMLDRLEARWRRRAEEDR